MSQASRKCSKCGFVKSTSEFPNSSNPQTLRTAWCKECKRTKEAERRVRDAERLRKMERERSMRRNQDPVHRQEQTVRARLWRHTERGKALSRAARLRYDFGITSEEYEAMVEVQEGRCAICGIVPKGNLHIDHDHTTGKIRELLCRTCNAGIGFFGDDVAKVEAAVNYLRRHGQMISV